MSIEMKDGRYFKAMMNFEFRKNSMVIGIPKPEHDGNILAALYTDDADKKSWTLVFRFRYYMDEKTYDSSDERKWFKAKITNNEEDAWQLIFRTFSDMAQMSQTKLNYVLIESDNAYVQAEKTQTLAGMHVQLMNPVGEA